MLEANGKLNGVILLANCPILYIADIEARMQGLMYKTIPLVIDTQFFILYCTEASSSNI
jgi:hypothetical protein